MTGTKLLLAASLAAILAAPLAAGGTAPDKGTASGEQGHCYGVNKCKGVGDCGGPGHSCKGQNSCKGQAFIDMDKSLCLRLENGSLTAPAKK